MSYQYIYDNRGPLEPIPENEIKEDSDYEQNYEKDYEQDYDSENKHDYDSKNDLYGISNLFDDPNRNCKFLNANQIIRNEKTTEKTPFYCELCDKHFTRKDGLKAHYKTFSHIKREERKEISTQSNISDSLTCSIPIRNKDKTIIGYTIVDSEVYQLIINDAISMDPNGYAKICVDGEKSFLHIYVYYD